MADALIAVSEETKEDVLKHFNVDESKRLKLFIMVLIFNNM